MKGFTKGLVQHRILIIILCAALVVPSVLGMVRTKTKYDLLYYLPQDRRIWKMPLKRFRMSNPLSVTRP